MSAESIFRNPIFRRIKKLLTKFIINSKEISRETIFRTSRLRNHGYRIGFEVLVFQLSRIFFFTCNIQFWRRPIQCSRMAYKLEGWISRVLMKIAPSSHVLFKKEASDAYLERKPYIFHTQTPTLNLALWIIDHSGMFRCLFRSHLHRYWNLDEIQSDI